MRVSISQPAYLPWCGYFDRVYKSDLAIVLDNVQMERRGFTHRNRILSNGTPIWLTLPTRKKGNYHTLIRDIRLNNETDWRRKHAGSITGGYGKSPGFAILKTQLLQVYQQEWESLMDILTVSTDNLFKLLGVATEQLNSSSMMATGKGTDLILNLCLEVGATEYVSGPFGREYLDLDSFRRAGIKVLFHDYKQPSYQQGAQEFVANLSVVDLIANCGENSLQSLISPEPLSET